MGRDLCWKSISIKFGQPCLDSVPSMSPETFGPLFNAVQLIVSYTKGHILKSLDHYEQELQDELADYLQYPG